MASPNPNSVVLKEIDVNNAHAKLRSRKRTLVRHRGNEKRKRPNAAMQEKERLKVFNDALETLQRVIPVRLPKGRKLHKKQTLKLASSYIQFLYGCLEGTNDWRDRHRFLWCRGSQQEDMLNAIDMAAQGKTSLSTSIGLTEDAFSHKKHAESCSRREQAATSLESQLALNKTSDVSAHSSDLVSRPSCIREHVKEMHDLDEILDDLREIVRGDCYQDICLELSNSGRTEIFFSSNTRLPRLPQKDVEKILDQNALQVTPCRGESSTHHSLSCKVEPRIDGTLATTSSLYSKLPYLSDSP